MHVLLLGAGMQGKAALHDLYHSEGVHKITAADQDLDGLRAYIAGKGYDSRVDTAFVDAKSPESLDEVMASHPDVVLDLTATALIPIVVEACVRNGLHLVNSSYPPPELRKMAQKAYDQGITILPECGLDPGIDQVLLGQAVRSFDKVDAIRLYGAGVPEPSAAATNPIGYKISWTFRGALNAYVRPGRLIHDGHTIEVSHDQLFEPANTFVIDIPGVGRMEAFPNGDALAFLDVLGIATDALRELGRYTLRWPGHCAFWRAIVGLHLLDDEPVILNGIPVDRKDFLAAALTPHLQYQPGERDIALVRVEVQGQRDGERGSLAYQVVEMMDLDTGLSGMSRTVGFTASIAAQMVGSGQISQRGLLSPVRDIPFETFIASLAQRGIQVMESWS